MKPASPREIAHTTWIAAWVLVGAARRAKELAGGDPVREADFFALHLAAQGAADLAERWRDLAGPDPRHEDNIDHLRRELAEL